LLVWDEDGAPPKGDWSIALWRAFAARGSDARSIPLLIEQRADVLRARFLAWIRALGDMPVDGIAVRDHLILRPGFSFWWMTLLAEKSNAFNSLQIIGVIKVLALEELLDAEQPRRVTLVTADHALVRVCRAWCATVGVEFELRPAHSRAAKAPLPKRLYHALPHRGQAIATLLHHLLQRFRLRGVGARALSDSSARLTICSYLFNLDKAAAAAGQLSSSFWTELHATLRDCGEATNWLLLFIPHDFVPNARSARRLIERFNAQGNGRQVHAALDGALGPSVIWRALRDYARVTRTAGKLRQLRASGAFSVERSKIDLWPYFERDWHSSLVGSAAMSNCIYLNLIESTLRSIPRQEIGCYLQENIGWELAFVHFWKASGHGKLIGVPHSTVRFWDLRYFFDPRSYERTGGTDLPLPDFVALNGPAAREAYSRGGYPQDKVIEVEALRYLHLNRLPAKREVKQAPALRVLVLGDYMKDVTRQQMTWLAAAAAHLPKDTRYVVKPHPACPINAADFPTVSFELTNLPLDKVLGDCDVAYTSNMTSAAVDAYSAGVPVVSVLDAESFNISPLRGLGGVLFVEDATELAAALRLAHRNASDRAVDFFHLDGRLSRWRGLLNLQDPA
jgi:surface carbohydrate biosynthesis protein (TIGR04326 family)